MSQVVGTVKELWRYPVKSMVGGTVNEAHIDKLGMLGDRGWALRDEVAGELTSVRKMPKLLLCEAVYDTEPEEKKVPDVSISLPNGIKVNSADEDVNQILSDYLNKKVTLWPLQPRSNWRHYRMKEMSGAEAMKKQFASKELPDMSSVSWKKMLELSIFSTPLGRYYDCYPLHILTSNSLKNLSEIEPDAHFCQQRFRPNIFIESADEKAQFDEFLWLNGQLKIGETIIKCESRTVRCLMPAQPQPGFNKDSKVLRTLEKTTGRHLGINASVIKVGKIQVGDIVEWIPAKDSKLRDTLHSVSGKLKTRLIHASLHALDKAASGK
ncbi:MAG: MOSC N-terminal beta barrel domain-containing protein [Pseudomonadales bacterium]|nr:MOSC N-terminal beta barrel domain-containing protein [Pseudomonadales bacterium]